MTFRLSTSRRTWLSGSHLAYPSHITTFWLQTRVSPFWIWSEGPFHGSTVTILSSFTQLMSGLFWNTPALSSTQEYKWISTAWREYNAQLLDLSVIYKSILMSKGCYSSTSTLMTFVVCVVMWFFLCLFAKHQVGNFFTLAGESSPRGPDKKILKPHCRASVRLHSFAVQVIQPWDNLTHDVVSAAYIYAIVLELLYQISVPHHFFVHFCYSLILIRSPQTCNGRTGNFGPKPCNPCINRWIAESYNVGRFALRECMYFLELNSFIFCIIFISYDNILIFISSFPVKNEEKLHSSILLRMLYTVWVIPWWN